MKDKGKVKVSSKQIKVEKSSSQDINLFDERPVLLPDDNDKLVFLNEWGKKLPRPEPTIQLKGVTYGKHKSWTLIKAQAGVGKTSLVMALASSWVSGKEHLGFKTIPQYGLTKVLIIDTEQSENDSRDAYNQIWYRLGYKDGDVIDKNLLNKIVHLGLDNISADIPRMMAVVEETLHKNNDIGLIVFDVGSDFCEDTNVGSDVRKFVLWLKRIQATVVITWHINEGAVGSRTGGNTARGHGKEFQRKCSYVVQMTMQGELGSIKADKCRKGAKPLLQYMFNEELGYFMETEQEQKEELMSEARKEQHVKHFGELFDERNTYTNKELLTAIRGKFNKSERTAQRVIQWAKSDGVLSQTPDKEYTLNIS